MREKLRALFTENLTLKIMALVIGFLIWLFVSNSNDPVKTALISNVPIVITNESSIADIGKVVEPEGSGTVTLRVTERRSVLNRLSRTGADFTVTADLQNINDMDTVPLTVTCTNPAVTWDEVELSPSSLKVTLEDKVEQAYPMSVQTGGSPSGGYAVGTTEIEEGKTILIAGPSTLLRIIDKVVAPVNVGGMYTDATLNATLKVYDKNGSELSDSQLSLLEFKTSEGIALTDRTVHVAVAMWVVEGDIRLEFNVTGQPAEGYRLGVISSIPETISLAGTREALASLDGTLQVANLLSVEGAAASIEDEIDLAYTLDNYDDLKLLSDADSTVTVTVGIEKTDDFTVDIPLSEIAVNNAPEEMKLVFTPADRLVLTIHGTDRTEYLTAQDIHASVDLSVCEEEGVYDIPVSVSLPEGYELSEKPVLKVSAQKGSAEPQSEKDNAAGSSDTFIGAQKDQEED